LDLRALSALAVAAHAFVAVDRERARGLLEELMRDLMLRARGNTGRSGFSGVEEPWSDQILDPPEIPERSCCRRKSNQDRRRLNWRKRLFAFISRDAVPATAYFSLSPGRVVELGMQIRL
jgi:hypothetical protein